jgi:hypothetical protein
MLRFLRPAGPAARRPARLFVEQLDDRAAPSGGLTSEPEPWAGIGMTAELVAIGKEVPNLPPEIVDFTATEVEPGLFRFTGRVNDESPGGLTVTFGGVPGCVQGVSVVTNADGTFELLVQVSTDGSDTGTVEVVTQDAAGQSSDVATYYLDPNH